MFPISYIQLILSHKGLGIRCITTRRTDMFPYFTVRGATKSSPSSTATFILRNRPTTHIKTGCGLDGDRRERGGEKGGRESQDAEKERRERKSFRQRRRWLCSLARGAGWMCDPGGQPSEQQQFTVAHNQPASQIPLSSSSRTRTGPAADSGARLPRVATKVLT